MNITISCEKKFEKDDYIVEEIENIECSDIKERNMRINIRFMLQNFTLDISK